jgi:hypothetical protein
VKVSSDLFERLLLCCHGIGLEVNESNYVIFGKIAATLWNIEMLDLICDIGDRDSETMIAELRLLSDSGCRVSDYESLIKCCSSSISELPRSSLSEMNVDLLHAMMSYHSLKLPSQDWLDRFVKEQMTRNTCYSILLELIRY